jgi:hypothetical protein
MFIFTLFALPCLFYIVIPKYILDSGYAYYKYVLGT